MKATYRLHPVRRLLLRLITIGLAMSLAFGVYPSGTAYAASFTVNSTVDAVDANPGDGICATAAAECTLRAAIQEANALPGADSISLPAGTYILTIPGRSEQAAAQGDLDINDDLTITGAGAAVTVIDADGLDRVFHFSRFGPAVVYISGVTIQGGFPGPPDAGGVQIGGGANLEPGSYVTFTDCVITNNAVETAAPGGGIGNRGSLTLIGCTVSDNWGSSGAGLWNNNAAPMNVIDSVITGNTGPGWGGGIWNSNNGYLTVEKSTISYNSASAGGGILNRGTMTVDNSTISNNTATSEGGGIFIHGRIEYLSRISNSTVSSNTASLGSGMYVYYSYPEVENSIFAYNGPVASCLVSDATIVSNGYNLDDGNSCNFGATGDLVLTDPLLGPLMDNGGPTETHALGAASSAIDQGTVTGCPAVDQRGVARPVDGDGDGVAVCDIGAFEFGASVTPEEALEEAIDYVTGLPSGSFKNSQLKGRLLDKMGDVLDLVQQGDILSICQAYNRLEHDILRKTDGEPRPSDWVTDPVAQQELEDQILAIMEMLLEEANAQGGCP